MIESRKGLNILTFDEGKHVYKLNGDKVKSVTGVKSALPEVPRLTGWKIKQATLALALKIKELSLPINHWPDTYIEEAIKQANTSWRSKAKEAADIGTLVHDYADQFEVSGSIADELHTKIVSHKDRAKILSCIVKFRRWKRANKDTIIAHESIVGSVSLGVAGKFDRLSNRRGLVVLSDFKTSSGIYVDFWIQLAGYKLLIKEWLGLDVDVFEIVRFGKEDGAFEVEQWTDKDDIKEAEEQFIRCVQTSNFMAKWEK